MSYLEDQRRREIHRALLEQSLQPAEQQMVSGRVVPYSPWQGLTKVAQAYMARKGIEGAESDIESGRQQALGQVMDTYRGRDEVLDQSQMTTPEAEGAVRADPVKAAMMAASNPYLKDSGISKMLAPNAARGSYTTPLEVWDDDEKRIRVISYDHRAPAGAAYLDSEGNPYTKPIISRGDAEARGLIKAAEGYGGEAGQAQAKGGGPFIPGMAPPSEAELSANKKAAEIKSESRTQAQIDIPKVEGDAEYLKDLVKQAVDHPGMPGAVGVWSPGKVASFIPGTKEADFMKMHDQIFGKAYEEAYQSLKGAGQITEFEANTVARAKNRMATATSEKAYKEAALDYIKEIDRVVDLARKRAGTSTEEPKTDEPPPPPGFVPQ